MTKGKDLEICAIELETKSLKLIILSLYWVPAWDWSQIIKNIDDSLKHLYKSRVEFLICGDINTDYATESIWKETTSLIINNIQSVAHS